MSAPSLHIAPATPPGQATSTPDFASRLVSSELSWFLEEAFAFHAFGTESPARGVTKHNWPALSFGRLDVGLRSLRHGFGQGLSALFHSLCTRPPTAFVRYYRDDERNYYLPFKDRQPTYAYHDIGNLGRFTIRIFSSDAFRSERFVESARPKKGFFRGLKLEKLAARRNALAAAVESILSDSALTALPTRFERIPPGATPPQTLTAHLYHHAAFAPRGSQRPQPETVRVLGEEIDALDTALGALEISKAAETAARVFRQWDTSLRVLEVEFAKYSQETSAGGYGLGWALVLTSLLRAYLSELRIRILATSLPLNACYVDFKKNSMLAVCLWEALTGVAWKTPALPNMLDIEVPTDGQYRLKHEAEHDKLDAKLGYLPQAETLIGVLAPLAALPGRNLAQVSSPARQDTNPASTLQQVEGTVQWFAERPVVLQTILPKKNATLVNFESTTYERWANSCTERHPVALRGPRSDIRKDSADRPSYFALTNVEPNPVSVLCLANSFWSQLCFFVASQLMATISARFGLDAFYKSQREKAAKTTIDGLRRKLRAIEGESDESHRKRLTTALELQRLLEANRFSLVAGCFASGGSFPPHKTHRDGRHFDLSMGPNLQPWRATEIPKLAKRALELLRESPATTPGRLASLEHPPYAPPVYRVERTPQDAMRATLLVDHGLMLNEVRQAVAKARAAAAPGLNPDDCYDLDDDTADAEKLLHGTPYWPNHDDAELGHLGSLTLLLSGPELLLHAAPIAFLRCIRSILYSVFRVAEPSLGLGVYDVSTRIQLQDNLRVFLNGVSFGFLPSDHHHHWHVYYPKESTEERLMRAVPLWTLLNVDLSGFVKYLDRYADGHLVHKELPGARAAKDVVGFCRAYEENRKQRLEKTNGALRASEDFLKAIAQPHIVNVAPDLVDPQCAGVELGLSRAATSTRFSKRSAKIKAYVSSLRDELMRVHAQVGPLDKDRFEIAEIARQLVQFSADVDDESADAEGDKPESEETRGQHYEYQLYNGPWWQ